MIDIKEIICTYKMSFESLRYILSLTIQNDWVPPSFIWRIASQSHCLLVVLLLPVNFLLLYIFLLKGEPNESELYIKIQSGPISQW